MVMVGIEIPLQTTVGGSVSSHKTLLSYISRDGNHRFRICVRVGPYYNKRFCFRFRIHTTSMSFRKFLDYKRNINFPEFLSRFVSLS